MVEVSIIPRVQTENQTIQSPISKCGDNWWRDVRVRSPYRGTDVAFRTLPALGDPEQVETFDYELLDEMLGDLERISVFVTEHITEITERQLSNIQKFLDRANSYIADAQLIWKLWSAGFTTTGGGHVPPWALNGQPQGPINANIEEGHHKDGTKWKRLVRSALKNLRCAEEVAKKATIRQRNFARHQGGRRFSGQEMNLIQPDNQPKQATFVGPGPKPTPATLNLGDEDELEEADIDLEMEPIVGEAPEEELPTIEPSGPPIIEEDDEVPTVTPSRPPRTPESETKSTKKKDNSILIAGAAILGVLALSKR